MKVVTFGEIMMRLQPPDNMRIVQSGLLEFTFGGAEANVAVSLANFGEEADFISKVPNNEIGQAAINSLRRYGVSTVNVVQRGERLGIYFAKRGVAETE